MLIDTCVALTMNLECCALMDYLTLCLTTALALPL
jgi:hypothetical protein